MRERRISDIKKKYHAKTLSDSAISLTFQRLLDIDPYFAEYVWLYLSPFDLSQLGLGLLYNILPIDYEPYNIGFEFELPNFDELLQGIWGKFKPIHFERLYMWMTDFKEYIIENFKEEFQEDLLIGRGEKAIYGITPYARGLYDPIVAREFLRATFHRLRLLRKPDESWIKTMEQIADYLEMIEVTDDNIFNRLMMLFSAQSQAFVLGLGVLGKSRLSDVEGDLAKIPFMDAQRNILDIKFSTLDHLQFGFILGVTPLGYGLLLPKKSIYKLIDDKKNPPFLKALIEKMNIIKNSLILTTFAYSNYNKPEEMINPHKSDRTNQYALLHQQRRIVEKWVETRIPPEESNPIRIRQYKNAVLQLISWRAKRHRWGFKAWKTMTEDQFKEWWLNHWEAQGLNRQTLLNLYGGMRLWLQRLQEEKVRLGKRVKLRRLRLALSL
ncbi:MAG: hypothetical protein DRP01_01620 [Archaeoglobales archaeon]|nr:MAG: hypothetical protein DRP01_01620 [Archaeoglobales archaeon]